MSSLMKGLQGFFPVLSLSRLGETSLQIGKETISIFIDAGATLPVLIPIVIKRFPPLSNRTVQIVGISNKPH